MSAGFADLTAVASLIVAPIQLVPLGDQGSYSHIPECKTQCWGSPSIIPIASRGDMSLPMGLFQGSWQALPRLRIYLQDFKFCFLSSWNLPSPTPTHDSGSQEVHCLQDAFAARSLLLAPHLHLQTVPRLGLGPRCCNHGIPSLSQRPCGL